ncbi:MAG TPA: CHRD domain-containing protein [Egibacteraceae bacterium]|jgi:hypothetical protein|nr:CHRD domain-containing protein [Egibacteraceae bacterium]
MRRFLVTMVVAALATLGFAGPVLAAKVQGADHGGRPLRATLTGAEEVPRPGDPDGTGTALVTVNRGQREICFELAVADIDRATAAHIHVGEAGTAGPVVIGLTAPSDGFSSGCVDDVDLQLIDAIRKNPAGFYVNVHNQAFPAGALRGQLAR